MSDTGSDDWRRITDDAFAKLPVGSRFSYTRTFSLADVAAFVAASGDFNSLHQDEPHAKRRFGGLILPRLLTGTMLNPIVVLLGILSSVMHFADLSPLYPGMTVTRESR